MSQVKSGVGLHGDKLKFDSGFLFVEELFGDNLDAFVVVPNGLDPLEAVEDNLEGIVQVCALGGVKHPDVELEISGDVRIPIAVALDVELFFVLVEGLGFG